MFPFSSEIQVNKNLFSATDIIDLLWSQLTEARQNRIDSVIVQRDFSVSVVLEDIYDRGNASAVMRSAEALGFTDFHLIELTERFKESSRTTAGADKWVEITRWKDTESCLKNLKANGIKIFATSLGPKAKPISEIDFNQNCALVLGNEKSGISQLSQDLADECVILPIRGLVQSYNISVAAALCFYHIYLHKKPQVLTAEQLNVLKAHYILRTLDSATDQIQMSFEKGKIKPLNNRA
jgi:tRNA (guanosine-2'-O-)-methyltransferase